MRAPAILTVGLLFAAEVAAQDLEPRRWTHLPVGTQFAGAGYAYTAGELRLDPALRIENAEVDLHTAAATYNRYFALAGTTARIDVQVPFQYGRWKGLVDGEPRTERREGFADPRLRLSVNLAGAPALDPEAFLDFTRSGEPRLVVGVGLAARAPLGEYSDDRLINLGENRFSFQPQLGAVYLRGPWSVELTGSAFLFTPNDDFFGGRTLKQEPLWAVETHVVRTLEDGLWISAGAGYGWAGESEIDGDFRGDDRSNLLIGVSFGFSLPPAHGVRVGYLGQDALQDVGTDAHTLLAAWSVRF